MTLEGYGVVPCLCGILDTFWYRHKVVQKQNELNGPDFPPTRCTTQDGLLSPMFFNVLVDNVIRTWLAMKVEDQRVANDGLVETAGRCLGVFCSNDVMVGSRYLDWLQQLMNVLVGLF